jgi:hypothetical protein
MYPGVADVVLQYEELDNDEHDDDDEDDDDGDDDDLELEVEDVLINADDGATY